MNRSLPRAGRASSKVILAVLLLPAGAWGGVVVNEIHYHPVEGSHLEFVELYNPDGAAVILERWKFSEGIDYVFPEGAVIEPNGFVVVAKDREQLALRFGLPVESLLGPFGGGLDNGGETLELEDGSAAPVDVVSFDDESPWDRDADGAGPSLERICASFDSTQPINWTSPSGGDPTPLAPNQTTMCPPGGVQPPAITINEINYHPWQDREALEEYVELRNNLAVSVNLRGHVFTSGIDFRFEEDLVLEPGAFLVVCRNKAHMQATYGLTAVAGDFVGQLSNDGERITLVDSRGEIVDSVRYSDSGDWPVAADGMGHSLEKIRPDAISDDPASWSEANRANAVRRERLKVVGPATSSTLILKIEGAGECLIDNVSLIDPARPTVNLVRNGGFDRGIDGWNLDGTHWRTSHDPAGGTGGGGAMRLAARGPSWGGGIDAVYHDTSPLVVTDGPIYELSFDLIHLTGSRNVGVFLSGSTSQVGLFWKTPSVPRFTPGAPNSNLAERLPPFVGSIGRFPAQPRPVDDIWITARVRAERDVESVKLNYRIDGQPETSTVDLFDDGQHGDALAEDDIYGGRIPAQPHNTIVTFQIEARDAAGVSTVSPPLSDPQDGHGFYVEDLPPGSPLRIFHLLVDHKSSRTPRAVLNTLNCQSYRTAAFAYRGSVYHGISIRMRGASVCMTPKPYLKLRFLRGHEFERQKKLNFQAIWTDKSLVREVFAWELLRDLGLPACREEFVRVHANGKYYGLYGALEYPDERFLERNRLNPDGNLYKAQSSNEEAGSGIEGPFEKKTNENGDFRDLGDFLNAMHSVSVTQLRFFFNKRADQDRIIEYHLGQILINNIDHAYHNHYLYHDTETGKWMALAWDLDLTFGKAGVFDDSELNPGYSPWFCTSVDGEFANHLLDKFFSDAGNWHRRAYLIRLHDALQEKYTEAFYTARIAHYRELLNTEQAIDIAAWGRLTDQGGGQFPRDMESNLARVLIHVRARRDYLLRYLRDRSRFKQNDRLKITEVHYNPPGPDDEFEFLELWNPDEKEIDLSGWSIEGIRFVFPEGTRAGPREVFVVAKDPTAFARLYGGQIRALGPYEGNLDGNGEILRVKDQGPGYPATVDFLRYGTSGEWPAGADGAGRSIELTDVTPTRDNDLGPYWRASLDPGGSPGRVEGVTPPPSRYHRGDANADGVTNLTDALTILGYLFQGAGEYPCLEAGDINASGSTNLADVLFLLLHLYQGGEPIPFPAPGDCEPIAPALCGASNC